MYYEMELEINETHRPGGNLGRGIMMTPAIGEDYWLFRVRLSDSGQAILGFEKFGTIGIGFAKEKDWNSNLPWACAAEDIYKHIAHNKGSKSISKADCIAAIKLVQEAAERVELSRGVDVEAKKARVRS